MQNILKKRNSLIWGVAAIVIGILILLNPIEALNTSVVIVGIGLLAVGAIQLISFFASYKKLNMSLWAMPFGGVLALILGIMLVVSPSLFVSFFMVFVAILIILLALMQLYSLISLKRAGSGVNSAFFVFPILLVLAGVVVLSFPVATSAWIVIFAGAWIVAYGVSELVGYFAIKNKPEQPKEENN